MLFSNASIAQFIEANFEPLWVSMRPVPQITIDFGNGHRIKRTLNGNIATWVCTADGTAIDVLPGSYAPQIWLREIEDLKTVHDHFVAIKKGQREDFLRDYHESQLGLAASRVVSHTATSELISGLHQDTQLNQTRRRRMAHQFLRNQPPSNPRLFTNWLYREVLGTDLEDPYLGLGETLFNNAPFLGEDATTH
ncbi:MAG: hypothetical protein P8J33_11885 [Pirellulaceae bacterium]|nr:hypothetical protein [Pirellulaceae bacterium]